MIETKDKYTPIITETKNEALKRIIEMIERVMVGDWNNLRSGKDLYYVSDIIKGREELIKQIKRFME